MAKLSTHLEAAAAAELMAVALAGWSWKAKEASGTWDLGGGRKRL